MTGEALYQIVVKHSPGTGWAAWHHLSDDAKARYGAMAAEMGEVSAKAWATASVCFHCGGDYQGALRHCPVCHTRPLKRRWPAAGEEQRQATHPEGE